MFGRNRRQVTFKICETVVNIFGDLFSSSPRSMADGQLAVVNKFR